MDIQMPVMDGPSACRIIRDREAAEGPARTPIVALTANAMSHHVAQYLAIGMDGVVAKPIEVSQLIEAINRAWKTCRPAARLPSGRRLLA